MQNEALDKEWFEIYKNGCAFDDIDYIKFNQEKLAKQKELFLAGLIDEPTLEYNVDTETVSFHKTKLLEFQSIVEADESAHPAVKKAYQLKIEDQLNKVALLEAVARQDDEAVTHTSKLLYGEPDKETMKRALSAVLYVAKQRNFTLGKKWEELADYFGTLADSSDFDYEDHKEDSYLTTEELAEFFKNALLESDIPWKIVISSEVLVITLNYKKETVFIPQTRRVTKTTAEALVEHEIKVHLTRHYNGIKSSLLLLSVGLNSYIKGEEGLANYRQIQVDRKSLPGTINYLNTSLVYGLYNGKQFDFRGLFKLSKEYYRMLGTPKNHINDIVWSRCLRTFRGTTSKTKNVFTRDSIYFSGYLNIKEMIDNNDPEVDRFLVGKYDPTNQEHIDILNQLDIR